MNGKSPPKQHELDELLVRFDAIRKRAHAGINVDGVPPTDSSIATFLQARQIADDQLNTLSQLRDQIEAGNGFLSGFTVWLARRNARKLERLLDKSESDRAAAMVQAEGGSL